MHNMKILVALAAVVGLGACSSTPENPMRALLDEAGSVVSYLPESQVRDTPPGTAMQLNLNGRQQLVTLGPRVSQGTSAGVPVVGQTTRDGTPRLSYVGPGRGDLAPGGTPYVERIDNGRPIIGYRPAPAPSGRPALETTP